ncbi:MAG: histidine kinase [Acidobacteriota bacterium]|nr:histidine kinase [Acidobacteriota bacterium]
MAIDMRVGAALLRTSLLACALAASEVRAGVRFDVWTTETGLPQNLVNAILQTRDGYLWVTTSDGLARFDGVRFTVFNKDNSPGLKGNRFTTLYEDADGSLWVGTDGSGLSKYEDGAFTTYTTEDGLPSNWTTIQNDGRGNLLILTTAGVVRWIDGRFVPYTLGGELPSSSYQGAYIDKSGGIWLKGLPELHRFSPEGTTTYTVQDGLSSLEVTAIYEDHEGAFWIGTKDAGLNRLKDGKFTVYTAEDGLPRRPIVSISEDRKGNLWIAMTGGGLSRLRGDKFTTYTTEQGHSSNDVNTVYEDREGNIWIGTSNSGLKRLREQTITVYSRQDGLSADNVYPILEDREGNLWIGTWSAGLNKYRDGVFTPYTEKDGLSSVIIASLYEDREGYLWIGTYGGGVNRFKDGRFTVYSNKDVIDANGVLAINQDREGSIWLGTTNGLYKYQNGQFTLYTMPGSLSRPVIGVIHEDREGALWIGTQGGLVRFRDGIFSVYTEKDGLSSNHVRAIYEDGDGVLWIGTYDGGLSRFRDGNFTRYSTRDGLFNHGVFQILEDRGGNFWMSSNRGIYRVSKKELNDFAEGRARSITSVPYGKKDGLLNPECNGGTQPAGVKTRDGKLWFPTQGGVAVINPEAVPRNEQPPPVVIEGCVLDREPVAFRPYIRIEPGQESLDIQYTGLSFIKPEQLKFKFKMEGLDDDWVEAGTRRTAYYPYLPPGDYTFRVIAANSDGVWNTEGASVRIIVRPPFWRTGWFLAASVLACAALILLLYKRRVAKLKKAHAAQEAFSRQLITSQESERKRIASELHDGLGQSLVIIKNRALLGLSAPAEPERAMKQLDEISAATSQAISEVREIAHNLRPYQLDEFGLTKAIGVMLKRVSNSSGIAFATDFDPLDGVFSKEDETNLYRIVQESVSNIVKHSGASEAKVQIKKDLRGVQILIRDNGNGFIPEAAGAGGPQQGGLGLTGMSERARMLGGRHDVHSAPGEGTTITIKISLQDKRDGS